MMSNVKQLNDSLHDDKSSDYEEIRSDTEENEDNNCAHEIDRNQVSLGDILGAGQFGDVFRGTFRDKDGVVKDVAIKTCKLQREEETADKLLEEAGVMANFDHKHIIRIYGVCSDSPVWIVMEYAAMGEVRDFLKDNVDRLHMDQLILYCYQISTALQYLQSKHFVHRDIAARNVLVSSWSCVKLADFGLSRWLSEDNYYKASKAMKLPIKWMAPESINYRRFTTHSDVWMFGVCMWEILTYGEKPFPGVTNTKVVELLESGVRLPLPAKDSVTCPLSIYHVMCNCWQLEPENRPRFADVARQIREILAFEKGIEDVENVCIAMKRSKNPCEPSYGSASADFPPMKPGRPLCRKHSGQIGGSIPELDYEARRRLAVESSRMQTNAALAWKSDNALDELQNYKSYSAAAAAMHDDAPLRFQNRGAHEVRLDLKNPTRIFVSGPVNHDAKTQQKQGDEEEEATRRREKTEWEKRLNGITLDRSEDFVYGATVDVVKVITQMTQKVNEHANSNATTTTSNNASDNSQQPSQQYTTWTMSVGLKLKALITSVDKILEKLPNDSKNQVVMATNVLNSDMATLIRQTKLAQQYSSTLLDKEYLRTMLQAGHALAFDTRNLLETVDIVRKKQIYLQQQTQASTK